MHIKSRNGRGEELKNRYTNKEKEVTWTQRFIMS